MFQTAVGSLGDQADPNQPTKPVSWSAGFRQNLDGIILITGDSDPTVQAQLDVLKGIFFIGEANASIEINHFLEGATRPGLEDGHEQYSLCFGV